jgi:hypothetical protein
MPDLTTAVCSITATRRRRFFWAAWWTGAPSHTPFRKPDAADGGERTRAAALAAAERAAGRTLTPIDAYWARAFMCVQRGEPPPPLPEARPKRAAAPAADSPWTILGLPPGASADAVRRAFRAKALETHPDQGGDAAQFRLVMRAFERLTRKRARRKRA